MWIRDHDLVLIAPWDFQSDKADIIWRYIAAHADKLEQDGYLDGLKQTKHRPNIGTSKYPYNDEL